MTSIERFKGTEPLPYSPLFGARHFRKSITEMKILSSLKGLNSRLEQAEEVISKLKNKATEILVQGVDRKKRTKVNGT